MTDYGHELEFGVGPTPATRNLEALLELAQLADVLGLDLVSFQDHPYKSRFLASWTSLAFIAARTSSIRLAPNVINLPLRGPVVLARSVATLDILSGGRAELGLGPGYFWDAIASIGGPRLSAGQAVDALSEAIDLIRATCNEEGGVIKHRGRHYRVTGAHPGPAHQVQIWVGGYKRRMLALTGSKADGWLPSLGYADPSAPSMAVDKKPPWN